jgi:hypothetical protein
MITPMTRRVSSSSFNEGVAIGIARNLARTHHRHQGELNSRSLVDVEERLRERGLVGLVQEALSAYAEEWGRLDHAQRRGAAETLVPHASDAGLDDGLDRP